MLYVMLFAPSVMRHPALGIPWYTGEDDERWAVETERPESKLWMLHKASTSPT